MVEVEVSGIKRRGFASMHPDKRRAIASKGGSAVPSGKRTFARDKAKAAEAGRKGGKALRLSKRRRKEPVT